MKRQLPALLAAFFITVFIATVISVMSVNALTNPTGVDVSNSPAAASALQNGSSSSTDQAKIAQLQGLVNQYQQREQQYQQMLNQQQQQLAQAAEQVQQFQQLLFVLQSRGLIAIDNTGRILITGRPGN
jgi:septal ring factor EnvC (AmiA/AmiB activator)